jgi:hypothetical protein
VRLADRLRKARRRRGVTAGKSLIGAAANRQRLSRIFGGCGEYRFGSKAEETGHQTAFDHLSPRELHS